MRRLRDSIAVNCPIDQAQTRIEEFFAGRRGIDGKVRLALPDHEVCIDARAGRDAQNLNDLVRVSWKAETDLPLPAFAGTLVTWGQGNPTLTFIELDGTYVPLGEIFDEPLGRRIAQRTAKDLLAQIAAAIADTPAAQGYPSPL